jgi:hypothetical protein
MAITRDQISQALEEADMSLLLADGFEDAFIGFSQRISEPALACYDYEKMVDVLVHRDGMSYEEAVEYIEFNVAGAWVGENTPIIVRGILD